MVYLFFADAKVQTAGLSSSWLAIFKCRRGSAVTLLGISKCRRGSADRGWLFLSADAKVQTLALSLSSLDYAHISSSDTFRFWNWALASSKTQSDKPEVTLLRGHPFSNYAKNCRFLTPPPFYASITQWLDLFKGSSLMNYACPYPPNHDFYCLSKVIHA